MPKLGEMHDGLPTIPRPSPVPVQTFSAGNPTRSPTTHKWNNASNLKRTFWSCYLLYKDCSFDVYPTVYFFHNLCLVQFAYFQLAVKCLIMHLCTGAVIVQLAATDFSRGCSRPECKLTKRQSSRYRSQETIGKTHFLLSARIRFQNIAACAHNFRQLWYKATCRFSVYHLVLRKCCYLKLFVSS